MSHQIKTLHLTFTLPILPRQIPQWRGAIIEWAGIEHDLFHNHKKGRDRYYRYPLIQYRVDYGKASIFAINEGADQLEQLLSTKDWTINWQGRPLKLQVEDVQLNWAKLGLGETKQQYRILHWLPFNQANYEGWQKAPNLVARIQKLESILVSHLLTFATGMQWEIPDQVNVAIQQIDRTKSLRFHGTAMLAFDLSFSSNFFLPENIGLGKVVSHGFGLVKPWALKNRKQKRHQNEGKKLIPQND